MPVEAVIPANVIKVVETASTVVHGLSGGESMETSTSGGYVIWGFLLFFFVIMLLSAAVYDPGYPYRPVVYVQYLHGERGDKA